MHAFVAVLRPVAEELYAGFEDGDPYLLTALTEGNAFLQVSWNRDPETGEIEGVSIHHWDDFDEPDQRGPDTGPASSLLINVSEVTNRIHDNRHDAPSEAEDG